MATVTVTSKLARKSKPGKKRRISVVNQRSEHLMKELPFKEFSLYCRTQQTREYYSFVFIQFMNFHNYRSTLEMVKKDPLMIEAELKEFMEFKRPKVSSYTLKCYVTAIKCFYVANRLGKAIDWDNIFHRIGSVTRRYSDRAYTQEEIQTMINSGFADERTKAIIVLLSSSGMRVGALPELECKHLKAINECGGIYQITAYAGSKEEYTTYCTPEARIAIDNYLSFRERKGEIITPETPLFRQQWNLDDELQAKYPKPVSVDTLQRIMNKLLISSGLRQTITMLEGQTHGHIRHEVHALHGFRKFYNTTLKNADNVKPLFIEMWLGHKVGLEASYFKPTMNDNLKEYAKCIDLLTIDPTNRLKEEVKTLVHKETLYMAAIQKLAEAYKEKIGIETQIFADTTSTEFDQIIEQILSAKTPKEVNSIKGVAHQLGFKPYTKQQA